jgi:nucleotidyltransferase substrate binding protein (TIGR01987 family)
MSDSRVMQAWTKFAHALANLERTMTLPEDNEDCRSSAILAFLLTQEAAWKVFKLLLKEKLAIELAGPRPVFQEAFVQHWLGDDETVWSRMTVDRNLVAHTYNEEQAMVIYQRVKQYAVILRTAHDLIVKTYPDVQEHSPGNFGVAKF